MGWYVLIFFGGLTLFFFLLGRLTSGTGADVLDWDPSTRMAERARAEYDDVQEMLEVTNRRRRAEGLPEVTEGEVVQDLRRRRRRS